MQWKAPVLAVTSTRFSHVACQVRYSLDTRHKQCGRKAKSIAETEGVNGTNNIGYTNSTNEAEPLRKRELAKKYLTSEGLYKRCCDNYRDIGFSPKGVSRSLYTPYRDRLLERTEVDRTFTPSEDCPFCRQPKELAQSAHEELKPYSSS